MAKREGYNVIAVFKDDGIGAFKDTNRPGFLSLLKAAEAGEFRVLLAVAEDRFARQPRASIHLAEICADAGITWHTVRDGRLDASSSEGELMSFFRSYQGRQDQRNKIESMLRRFETQRAEGKPLWGVRPFGFELNRIDHREDEAAELRWAYDSVLAGASLRSIMRAWQERGIETSLARDRREKRERGEPVPFDERNKLRTEEGEKPLKEPVGWSYATVRQLLMRPRNAGLMERDGAIIEDITAVWTPVVSRDVWERTCAILTDPARSTTTSLESKWLCAGLIYCRCGSVLRSGTGGDRKGRFPVYQCAADRVPGGDRHVSIKPADVEPLVREAIVSTFLLAPPTGLPGQAAEAANVQRLQTRLREVREGIAELLAMVGTPGVKMATITKPTSELGIEAEQIEAELEAHKRHSAHAAMLLDAHAALWSGKRPDHRSQDRATRVRFADAAKLKVKLGERFDGLPLEQRRTLVRTLVSVTVHPWQSGPSSKRVIIQHLGAPDLDAEDET